MTTPSSVTAAPDATVSAEAVAAAVAGVDGVHALGRSIERASSAVRERIGLTGLVPGVKVELDRGGPARVAVSIVVDYPHKLHEVSEAVREAALGALTTVGSDRVDVEVRVTDVWGPFDTEPVEETEQRPDRPAGTEPAATGASDDPTRVSSEGGDAAPHQGETAAARDAHAPDADTDAVIADALADVAESVAHAAEDVRSRRID